MSGAERLSPAPKNETPQNTELQVRVQEWLARYDQIIDEHFVLARKYGLTGCIADFSTFYTDYERVPSRKMNPENVAQGLVSCSSATLLVGRWWERQKGLEPWYIIDLEGMPSQQHTLVYLPDMELSIEQVREALDRHKEGEGSVRPAASDKGRLIDYTKKQSIRILPPPRDVPDVLRLIQGSAAFLENRIKVFSSVPGAAGWGDY